MQHQARVQQQALEQALEQVRLPYLLLRLYLLLQTIHLRKHHLKKKKSHKPLVISLVIVAILVVCAIPSLILPATANISANNIGIITINGVIGYDGSSSSPAGLKTLLDRAQDDPTVKAVVLRINSGGGSATAGEEMAHYVKEFKKPVVVSSAAVNASAAYEISAQAQKIYVNKTTAIGALGVGKRTHSIT